MKQLESYMGKRGNRIRDKVSQSVSWGDNLCLLYGGLVRPLSPLDVVVWREYLQLGYVAKCHAKVGEGLESLGFLVGIGNAIGRVPAGCGQEETMKVNGKLERGDVIVEAGTNRRFVVVCKLHPGTYKYAYKFIEEGVDLRKYNGAYMAMNHDTVGVFAIERLTN